MAKPNLSMDCTQKRRVLETHGSLDLTTGTLTMDRSTATWVVRACGAPLFTDAQRERGTCDGCASGWSSPGNKPADAADPTLYG
jgi:hypothetical protein